MARLFQCGFETGDTQQIGSDSYGSGAGTVTIPSATPAARNGTYSLKCTVGAPNTSVAWTQWLGKKVITHASKTELWYAFGLRAVHTVEPSAGGSALVFVAYDTAGNANVLVTLDSGTLRAYYATAGGGAPTFAQCTLIGTASAGMSMDAWHLIEIRIVVATGSTGNFELYLDGASVISTSSQRTAQTNANLGQVALMCGALQSIVSIGAAAYHAFDDLRVNDTTGSLNNGRPGDEAIRLLVPNAAGDSAQFTRGGADSGNNYGQVDDIPPNGTTDYVYSSTVGHLDLYNIPTLAVSAIGAVQVIVQAFNSDGGGGALYLPTKTPAGQSDGTLQAITGSPTYYTRTLETDPFDSSTWTQAKLDALQIGVKVQA